MKELFRTWTREEKTRGRFSHKHKSVKSTVLISRKYNLDPKLLVKAFAEALTDRICHYGSLKISCRETNQVSAIFLITEEEKVVSQFRIELELLRNIDYFQNLVKNLSTPNYVEKEICQRQMKIGELRFGMKGIDVKARIVEIAPKRLVNTRFGTEIYVSNARIADETGTIRFSLWNGQIDKFSIGDEVEIENCRVASFAGEPQLRIGRNGAISVI